MQKKPGLFHISVIVSALGFFVDVYDLLLFSIIRRPSLAALGLDESAILHEGERIISVQMIGLVIGGIIWGVLGDKKGRLKVLFGSILLYSLANIANGFVHTVPQYLLLRFIAGLGLAGELGAGITLVNELLPKEKRGIASAMIASFGILGAVTAFFMNELFNWRTCYFIGGGMGLVLLILRISLSESGLYRSLKDSSLHRGNFLMFFTRKDLFKRYLKCILIGLPAWYVIGVLITFADQFGKQFGIEGIDPARAVVFQYCGIALGDMTVGLLSQYLKSRKKALLIFYCVTFIFCLAFFLQHGGSSSIFYAICFGLGFGTGFSVVYITWSAELFGTNLRASAAISIPNMVRGALPLILLLFQFLRAVTGNYITGAWITGLILLCIAVIAALNTRETFGRELDFVEK